LGWSHVVEIMPLEDALKRDFYAEMCRVERWSVRTLRAKIRGMLFERTALSKKPAKLARQEGGVEHLIRKYNLPETFRQNFGSQVLGTPLAIVRGVVAGPDEVHNQFNFRGREKLCPQTFKRKYLTP
jgi:hypothetical protein